nr:MAG: RNA-dependent RNA polymerase [Sanya tombus-like virus 1]UUW21058.1 MAG: RNA-dependent RNA polymerase [Sanya tombus-like virus 1]UUW21061.1 MAG: RNA-dependent RNA polymerase [Sanya tombus-like virus 1]UUW21064.1 MAG: RNA-dependent RNA polymerase [Sanya tombus-like virus 1]UUW21067.1 MAG: RNA-dependent RNA polymerase [Sanya tombus-like virus 1]
MEGRECDPTRAPITPDQCTLEPDPLGITKIRRYMRVTGLCLAVDIIPFNHTFTNLVRAVAERVFFVKKDGIFQRPPSPVSFSHRLFRVKESLKGFLPSTVPWTYEEFLGTCRGRKQKIYRDAYDSLFTDGPVTSKDARIEVFIKYEKTDCTTKVDPVPRVISPRSPRYNLCLGRFLKKAEPKIFKSLGKLFGEPTVIKGYNAYQSAKILRRKWDRFADPVAVGLDASRFDQHVSIDALRWEHSIYLECFPIRRHRVKLQRLLNMQLVNNCVGYTDDGKLKYKIEGTRMSGDMNTSLGNCLIMCCMIKAYLEETGVDGSLANNGDDCVVFMDRSDLAKFSHGLKEWFLEMGFDMKVEDPVDIFEKVEFCQTQPIFDGRRWLMVRKPDAIFSKDTTFLQPYQSPKQVLNWMYAVGQGGLRLTGGIPIVQNFYRAYMKYGKPGKLPEDYFSWYQRQQLNSMDRDFGPVTPECRDSFHSAFGFTPTEQQVLERAIDSWVFRLERVAGFSDPPIQPLYE